MRVYHTLLMRTLPEFNTGLGTRFTKKKLYCSGSLKCPFRAPILYNTVEQRDNISSVLRYPVKKKKKCPQTDIIRVSL